MKQGVTCIGSLIVDLIKRVDAYPSRGMLANVRAVTRCVGGLAANTAIDLKTLAPGLAVRSMGMVGHDENGEYLIETLEKRGVDTSGILIHPALPTATTDVMTEDGTGIRTFFQQQGACAAFTAADIPYNSIDTTHSHLGYALLLSALDAPDAQYGTGLARALAMLKGMGIRTSIDLVSDTSGRYRQTVLPCLPYVDVLFLNEIEAEGVTDLPIQGADGTPDPALAKAALASLLEEGTRELAVMHAPSGGYCMARGGMFVFEPALSLPEGFIRGTVGAGDAFCAGVLLALIEKSELSEALRRGNLAAAACLTHDNAIDGLRPANELTAYVNGGYLHERNR